MYDGQFNRGRDYPDSRENNVYNDNYRSGADKPDVGGRSFNNDGYGFSGSDLESSLFFKRTAEPSFKGEAATERQAERQSSYTKTMYADEESDARGAQTEFEPYNEDTYPSVTTMQFKEPYDEDEYPYEEFRDGERSASDKRFSVTTRGKVIAAVYAIVVATILLLIILNTRLLKNMNTQIAAKETEIVRLTEDNRLLAEQLDDAMSNEAIEAAAEALGMVHD
ncbi:MAG: hypothetical protein J5762_02160 [Clostridia bacterium]|nr:hypothetical protein [Clostridia bacterium]